LARVVKGHGMSQAIMVPISGQGTITDPNAGTLIPTLAQPPFDFTDVFIYSHGWWTTANDAMVDYTRFTVGFATTILRAVAATAAGGAAGAFPKSALEIGLHWPSMVSEDSNSIINVAEPLSFYNRAKMADDVGQHGGYALIRLILTSRQSAKLPPPVFHLIGHSFGTKVVCSALQALAIDPDMAPLLVDAHFNLVLLQGAFDNDSFEPKQDYANVLSGIPNLRVLMTKSGHDTALSVRYIQAQKINFFSHPVPAIGAIGPTPTTYSNANGKWINIDSGYNAPPDSLNDKFYVADLTSLHEHDGTPVDDTSGHHSDIYLPEIYNLLTAFLF